MLHQARGADSRAVKRTCKQGWFFWNLSKMKWSTLQVTLPGRGLSSTKRRSSPPSQLLCNAVGERRALAGVQGIKIKLHTFTLFGQHDTAQGVKWMLWDWACCCASKRSSPSLLSYVLKGIMFHFRAPSVIATMLAIVAEVKCVRKPLCYRL